MAASTPDGSIHGPVRCSGIRVATSFDGQTTRYTVDPAGLNDVVGLGLYVVSQSIIHRQPHELGNVVGTYDAIGGLIAHFTYGAGLISLVDANGATSYYDFDNLGSTAGLTGAGRHLPKSIQLSAVRRAAHFL